MVNPGDLIIYLRDVSAPSRRAGRKGDTKIVEKTISRYDAKLLERFDIVRQVTEGQVRDVLIELGLVEPETKPGPETKPEPEPIKKTRKRPAPRLSEESNNGGGGKEKTDVTDSETDPSGG